MGRISRDQKNMPVEREGSGESINFVRWKWNPAKDRVTGEKGSDEE